MKPIFKLKMAGVILFFTALMLWVPQYVFAQNQVTITGKVLDEFDFPLPGARVEGIGSGRFVATNDDGTYSIAVPAGTTELEVSFIGMKTQQVVIEGRSVVDVVLVSEAISLNEAVMIGYGTQRRADVTSAVSSVKSEDFVKAVVQDAAQLIQGRIAGLVISNPSGDPTQGSQMLLRGNSTLSGSTRPLVLIDGIRGDLNTVAPEDIEAIDVLKDASAAAIYGTRGAAGVIIVTTKRSRNEMRQSVEYSSNLQIREWYKKHDFMTADDLRARWNGTASEDGRQWTFIGANIEDFHHSTDWLDEISQTGIAHIHNLTFRGGSRNTNYVASLNYRDMKGNFLNSDNNRYMARAEINHGMFDGILRLNFSAIVSKQWGQGSSMSASGGSFENPGASAYRQASIRNPTEPVYGQYVGNPDGTGYFLDSNQWAERPVYVYSNPVALIKESLRHNVSRNTRMTAGATLTPISDLNLRMTYTQVGSTFQSGSYNTLNHYQNTIQSNGGSATLRSGDNHSDIFEITGDYRFNFDQKHHFSAMAGYSYEYNFNSNMGMTNRIFPTDAFSFWNIGAGNLLKEGNASMSSDANMERLIAFFGRVTYNFNDKYLLMASIRREGSSRFGADNKWGNFPGVSFGWRLDNEGFLKDVKWLNQLKLRAGWGITGINAGNRYASLARLQYETSGFFYANGGWVAPLRPNSNANPNLRWEKKNELNGGLDITTLGGRLGGTIDVFYNKTTDALYNYSVSVPPWLFGSIYANVMEIENTGVEVALNVVPVRKRNLEWRADFTYTHVKNNVVSIQSQEFPMSNNYIEEVHLGEPIQQNSQRIMPGYPMGTFWGLKSIDITPEGRWIVEGFVRDGDEITGTVAKTIAANTGYPQANNNDKQVLGNGSPKHVISWNNTIYYKKFDANVNMRGSFGFQIINHQRMYYENPNIQYNVLNSAFDKVYGKAYLGESQEYVSYYIEEGDYWKISDISLGYTFDLSSKNKIVRTIRLSGSIWNIATITGYKGLDPEVSISRSGGGIGFDERDKYPTVRTYTFGLNFTF